MLLAAKADKALLLRLRDWRSVTRYQTHLHYDVTLELFDRAGESLAAKPLRGKRTIDADDKARVLDAISNAVPAEARKVLEALLNDKPLLAALAKSAKEPGRRIDEGPFD